MVTPQGRMVQPVSRGMTPYGDACRNDQRQHLGQILPEATPVTQLAARPCSCAWKGGTGRSRQADTPTGWDGRVGILSSTPLSVRRVERRGDGMEAVGVGLGAP